MKKDCDLWCLVQRHWKMSCVGKVTSHSFRDKWAAFVKGITQKNSFQAWPFFWYTANRYDDVTADGLILRRHTLIRLKKNGVLSSTSVHKLCFYSLSVCWSAVFDPTRTLPVYITGFDRFLVFLVRWSSSVDVTLATIVHLNAFSQAIWIYGASFSFCAFLDVKVLRVGLRFWLCVSVIILLLHKSTHEENE